MNAVRTRTAGRPAWLVPASLALVAGAAATRVAPPAGIARWFVVAVVAAFAATLAAAVASSVRAAAQVIDSAPLARPALAGLPEQRRAPEAAVAWALDAARVGLVDA